MDSYCSLCGKYHPSTTAGCSRQTQQVHIPAKTITFSEPHETCPTCNGSGWVPASIQVALKKVAKFLTPPSTRGEL